MSCPCFRPFGAGSVAGNLIGAHLADRALLRTIGGTLVYSVLLLGSSGALMQHVPTALVGVFLHSAFNVANALGAWLGGAAIAAGWGRVRSAAWARRSRSAGS